MESYVLVRDGTEINRARLERRADGTLWCGGYPLLDKHAPEATGLDLLALAKAKQIASIPASCYAHVGHNAGGLTVVPADEWANRRQAAHTPADVERAEIRQMLDRAEDLRDHPGEYFPARQAADARLATWQETYPAEARAEQAQALRDQAVHERDIAAGALVYDADGSLSQAAQQRRHDEYLTKAEALDAQAAELEG